MSDITQDSLKLDIRYEASLDDFQGKGFRPILDAIDKLAAGHIRELFIIGSYGYGKTHLAAAIFQHYTKSTKNSAISLSLGDLIKTDPDATALNGLEMFDLIIIDDMQLIRYSYEWQEGLFHLINRVHEFEKQLVFFSDRPARELQIGLLDLSTRLSLAPQLNLPDNSDTNDRSALIHNILKHKNWRLPEEIFQYLLLEGPRNAADIIIVLNHITPLLTHLSRVQVPKKVINEAKNIIDRETILLEFADHSHDGLKLS